jgi:hypothetical protein
VAFTREERSAIDEVIKRVLKLERRVENLLRRIGSTEEMLDRESVEVNMADWTEDQWREFLRPFLAASSTTSSVPMHDHTSDQEGGDCFAKLGANLID